MKTLWLLFAVTTISASWASPIFVESMLPETLVDSEGDRNVFAIPFDYRDGNLFTVHVEPSSSAGRDGVNLRTVVRHGSRQTDGSWYWRDSVIEERTIRDAWHTQASIALDSDGFVHVAYNMHNMPWQYSVSTHPFDISSFEFRGQAVTTEEIETVKFQNKTPFPNLGTAAIPGTQVTYPAFYKNARDELFVTYRFALRPAKVWEQRAFAGGVAKYDTTSRKWSAIGGSIVTSNADIKKIPGGMTSLSQEPLIYEDAYSVYLTTLGFDNQGGMHVFWNWRAGGAGMDTVRPSYAYSPTGHDFFKSNGESYSLPVSFNASDPIIKELQPTSYYAPKSVATLLNGNPLVIVQPTAGGRQLISLDRKERRWSKPEPTPYGASEIVVDKQGRVWAFASGLKVFVREPGAISWELVGDIGRNLCAPRVKYFSVESRFIVHAKTCDEKRVTIFSFRR